MSNTRPTPEFGDRDERSLHEEKLVDNTEDDDTEADDDTLVSKNDRPAAFFRLKKDEKAADSKPVTDKNKEENRPVPTEAEQLTGASDSEPSPEDNLSEEEVRAAVGELVAAEEEQIGDALEAATDESPEETAAIAQAAFLAAVREQTEDIAEPFTEESIDAAFRATVDELELPEHDGDPAPETLTSSTEETTEPLDDLPPPPPAGAVSSPPPPPPARTTTYFHSSPPNPSPFGSVSSGESAPPVVSAERTLNPERIRPTKRRNDVLIGAVVGYVIGRRGGRKRTERRLQPTIDRLQDQVAQLHEAISMREEKIRSLALASAAAHVQQPTKNAEDARVTTNAERLQLLATKRAEARVHREKQQKIEKFRLRGMPEKIGAVKLSKLDIFIEKRLIDGKENHHTRKAVEIMTEAELLEKIGDLKIDGLKVAEAYRRKRLDLEVLREITKRYLRSGNYEAVFRYELRADPEKLTQQLQSIEQLQQQRDTSSDHELLQRKISSVEQPPTIAVSQTEMTPKVQTKKKSAKLPVPWIAVVVAGAMLAVLFLLSTM